MDTQDGQQLVKNLAHFVRTHERALANATQFGRQQSPRNGSSSQSATAVAESPTTTIPNHMLITSSTSTSTSSTLAAALSLPLPYLNFASQNIKTSTLALTANHLFYLLSQFEDLGISVGPMNVRLESLHADTSANYVSFLGQSRGPLGRSSDRASIHSVSSIRSVMSGMTSLWSSFSLGAASSAAKAEKQLEANITDLKYLYSAFTKLPSLRLAPDRRAQPIQGYEEFPFDTAVPLFAFKNLHALEIIDIDIRQFYGWDRLAEGLRYLAVKRAGVDDPMDLLINIVLDDMDKRRRRSSKPHSSPASAWAPSSSPKRSPTMPPAELVKSNSAPGSPDASAHAEELGETRGNSLIRSGSADLTALAKGRPRSSSPVRPTSSRTGSAHGHIRGSHKVRRSGSGSSQSSLSDGWYAHRGSSSNLLAGSVLSSNKWRFLKHLSLADNSITSITAESLAPLANTLHSLDLSANLFAQVPDSLASLTALRALNLSYCMIDSLHSLTRNPLPAIIALNLRGNRLGSIAGIERLYPLERLDLRENQLTDPTEMARLTGIPDIREIWVAGNPFTLTHSNYRITIFNLFRTTPGFAEDIFIEASGPSKNERRLLVDRVAERASVPVVKPPPPDYGLPRVHVNKPTIVYDEPKDPGVLRPERPVPTSVTSEGYNNTARRRRTAKRRIVDLSIADLSPSKPKTNIIPSPKHDVMISAEHANAVAAGSDSGYGVSPDLSSTALEPDGVAAEPRREPQRSLSQPDIQRVDTAMDTANIPQLPPLETIYQRTSPIKTSPPDTQDWSMSGEMYRKKIEALRSEVGNGWLSVLSEESWEAPKIPESTLRPGLTGVRAHSQQVIHSGRTLG